MERPLIINNQNIYNDKIFEDSAKIYSRLKTYDDAYVNYLTCLEENPVYENKEIKKIQRDSSSNYVYNGLNCTPPDSSLLIQDIKNLQKDIKKITNVKDTSYNEIIQKHKDLIQLRNKMDLKLQELYNVKGSIPLEVQKETDATLYATIVWTILASCIVYLIFAIET